MSNYIIHLDETYRPLVDNHSLLDLPPQERMDAGDMLDNFIELLLKYLGVNLTFDNKESQDSLLPLLEYEVVKRRFDGKLIYDNEAFMVALSDTLTKELDKETGKPGSFCYLFLYIYRKRLTDATAELIAQKKGGSLKAWNSAKKVLKPLDDILRKQEERWKIFLIMRSKTLPI